VFSATADVEDDVDAFDGVQSVIPKLNPHGIRARLLEIDGCSGVNEKPVITAADMVDAHAEPAPVRDVSFVASSPRRFTPATDGDAAQQSKSFDEQPVLRIVESESTSLTAECSASLELLPTTTASLRVPTPLPPSEPISAPRLPPLLMDDRVSALANLLKTSIRDVGRACADAVFAGRMSLSNALYTLSYGYQPIEEPADSPSLSDVHVTSLSSTVRETLRELLLLVTRTARTVRLPAGAANLLVELLLSDRCPPHDTLFREVRSPLPSPLSSNGGDCDDDEEADEGGDTFDADAPIGVVGHRHMGAAVVSAGATRGGFMASTKVVRQAQHARLVPRPQTSSASPWKHAVALMSLLDARSSMATQLDLSVAGAVCAKYGFHAGFVAASVAEISSCTTSLAQNPSSLELDVEAVRHLVTSAAATAVYCDDLSALRSVFESAASALSHVDAPEDLISAVLESAACALAERDAVDALETTAGGSRAVTAKSGVNAALTAFEIAPRPLILSLSSKKGRLPESWISCVDIRSIFMMTSAIVHAT
jgi:hypothetical protein